MLQKILRILYFNYCNAIDTLITKAFWKKVGAFLSQLFTLAFWKNVSDSLAELYTLAFWKKVASYFDPLYTLAFWTKILNWVIGVLRACFNVINRRVFWEEVEIVCVCVGIGLFYVFIWFPIFSENKHWLFLFYVILMLLECFSSAHLYGISLAVYFAIPRKHRSVIEDQVLYLI